MVENGIEARKTADASNTLADAIKVVVSAAVVGKNTLEALFNVIFAGIDIVGAIGDSFSAAGMQLAAFSSAQGKALSGDLAGAWADIQKASAEGSAGQEAALNRAKAAIDAVRTGFADASDDVAKAMEAIWTPTEKAADAIEKTGGEAKKARAPLVALVKAGEDAAKAAEKERKARAGAAAEYAEYRKNVEAAAAAVAGSLDPMVALENAYQKDADAVAEAIALRMREGESFEDLIVLLQKLAKARGDDEKALKRQMDPIGTLIDDMRDEVELMKLGNIERQREILLRQSGAKATAEQVAELDELLRRRELEANSGLFGSMLDSSGRGVSLNTFEELLGGAFDTAIRDGFKGGVEVLQRGFKEAFKDGASAAQSIAGIANFVSFGAEQFRQNPDAPLRAIAGIAAQIPGIVGAVAQAVQAIDAVFGGRLLGTNYERDSAAMSLSIGQSGITGQTSVTDVRQRSLFRGRQWRTTNTPLDSQAQSALNDYFEQLNAAIAQAARALGTDVGPLITGAFKQEFDKDGNLVRQFSTVMGRTFQESLEDFQKRVLAENLLATLERSLAVSLAKIVSDNVGEGRGGGGGLPGIGGGDAVMSEIQTIANRWRSSAEDLLAGAQFLLLAQGAINDGAALLGSATLTQTTDFAESLQQAGESLSETFIRLQTASQLFEQALSLAGVKLTMAREDFVTFAAEIADAAGGIERAASLWQTYFSTFYTDGERAAQAAAQLQRTVDEMLSGLGLSAQTSMEEFRDAFESALPNLSAEEVAEWLRAAEAIANLNQAEQALADARAEEIQAVQDLAALLSSLAEGPATEFGQDIADITSRMAELTAEANELARATGRAGASQEELGQITAWAARQFDMAIDRLRNRITDLAQQLYGTELDRLNSQISEIEERNRASQAAGDEAARAMEQRYQQELQFLRQIRGFIDSLKISALSPLNPQQQLGEAQRQFQSLFARAQGGDVDALGQLQGAAQALLEQGRTFYGSSDQFTSLFESVVGALESLGVTSQGGGPTVTLVPSDELNELFARREEILLEQEERNRQALAEALAVQLGELSAATQESAILLAEQMGISLETLVSDLGLSLEDLTATTAQELADVARTLNLSVSELATAVGASLGELTETNSLLNDAFEAEIADLPEGIQAELLPLLRAVEDAVTDTDANSALALLRGAVDELAPELRDELAPYLGLEQTVIEPIDNLATIVADYGTQQVALLERIANAVDPGGATAPPMAPKSAEASNVSSPAETNRLLSQLINAVNTSATKQAQATELAANKMARAR